MTSVGPVDLLRRPGLAVEPILGSSGPAALGGWVLLFDIAVES